MNNECLLFCLFKENCAFCNVTSETKLLASMSQKQYLVSKAMRKDISKIIQQHELARGYNRRILSEKLLYYQSSENQGAVKPVQMCG